ncbi:cytochrome P450 [Streptomyces viridochromogenes]|uniref:cytochrome P450 n=1 Tax=Streptomyces viridochromogenes TaxID=1938 RepID=UPI00069FE069|nr:cytochrome P450 [Streptomyces viridochromogenes]KOG21864.1 cytochrome P450 [Streptomyces viridochromogenes]KOG29802.1 cytochrome P450 [Streptomyces viridochromogenes]
MRENELLRLPLPSDNPLEPPAEWEQLRRRCPVTTVELPSGDKAAYLTRYDDVKALLSDARFVRPTAGDVGAARIAPEGAGGPAADGSTALALPDRGEPHLRWRRQVGKYFTAKRMTALRPGMVRIAEGLVDDMVRHGQPADLKAGLGFPLPVYVICEILGVPAGDRDRFSHWSDAFLNVSRFTGDQTRAAYTEFAEYMSAHIATTRAAPGEDLIGMVIRESEGEGQGLTDEELLGTAMGLLVAGHETTANMIGKMVAMLLADRTRWERLLADPTLVRTAVDEALRFDTNLGFGIRRYLTEDVEVDGELLPSGTTVVCSMPAANRDERVFSDADDMVLSRSPNPHLTFGAGPHSCLGQSLARTELQVTLEVLLRKLPNLRLDVPVDELKRVEGLLVGGLRTVPVRW